MGKVRLWVEEEDLFLKNNYPDYGPKWCGEKLNRVTGGVQIRAIRLGLKSNKVKIKYHKDNLVSIISNSKNMTTVLNKLNLRCAGGNYQTIKKYIELYNIDITHFETDVERYSGLINYNTNNKIPIENILIVNSTYNRANLKLRLISENLLEYKCVECCNIGEWNGKPISLQLDHINGIHDDNRLENLRFLCPNCHSQTETYAGKKNKVNIKIEKHNGLSSLQKELALTKRKTNRPNYETLIKEIEELGYSGTGRKYGVSDNAIRKWKKFYENHEK
jgi:hypothetical protein